MKHKNIFVLANSITKKCHKKNEKSSYNKSSDTFTSLKNDDSFLKVIHNEKLANPINGGQDNGLSDISSKEEI